MESIHGRRLIGRNRDHRQQPLVGGHVARLRPRRYVESAPRAAQQISVSREHEAISRRPQPHGHSARACTSAYAEVYSDPTRIAQISQNRPSDPSITTHSIDLGTNWLGAATPLFRDRIAVRVFPR